MALTLIKEDGTGTTDGNSYASVADSDAYHDGHLYATAWTTAAADRKAAALVMATRLIDAEYQFGGTKANEGQALQWPRYLCPDVDAARLWSGLAYVSSDVVPKVVVDSVCELGRELLIADRTAAPAGEGLKYFNDGSTQTGYDKNDQRPVISAVVQAMLSKYGALIKSKSGAVPLVRT